MASVQTQGGTPARSLFVVRIAIVSAVVLFTAMTWYVRSRAPQGTDPSAAAEFAWPILGIQALTALGVVALSWAGRRTAERARLTNVAIMGWAVGEMAAIAGIVFWFVTGSTERLGFGLLVFAAALLLFRIPPDAPQSARLHP